MGGGWRVERRASVCAGEVGLRVRVYIYVEGFLGIVGEGGFLGGIELWRLLRELGCSMMGGRWRWGTEDSGE